MSVTSTNIIAGISIHAPSRERPQSLLIQHSNHHFNPRSLAGATLLQAKLMLLEDISIHAPSRERPLDSRMAFDNLLFQSTLPRGSDYAGLASCRKTVYFNPRSLAGATLSTPRFYGHHQISIHAPSRERQARSSSAPVPTVFQSTLPRGSDC